MPVYYCTNCSNVFDEPHIVRTSYEAYYGAPVSSFTPLTLYTCPRCGNEDLEEQDEFYYEEEED